MFNDFNNKSNNTKNDKSFDNKGFAPVNFEQQAPNNVAMGQNFYRQQPMRNNHNAQQVNRQNQFYQGNPNINNGKINAENQFGQNKQSNKPFNQQPYANPNNRNVNPQNQLDSNNTKSFQHFNSQKEDNFSKINYTVKEGVKIDTDSDNQRINDKTKIDLVQEDTKKNTSKNNSNKKGILDFLFGSNNKKSSDKNTMKIHRTAQESVPYINVYKNGIIETSYNHYSKSYLLHDVNFNTATDDEQWTIFEHYESLLNMFGPEVKAEITIFNRNVDKEKFRREVLLKMRGDGLDKYRIQNNEILESKMSEGKNNVIHEKYLTLNIEADDIDTAVKTFSRLDGEVNTFVKKINGVDTSPLSLEDRLGIIHEIYNPNAEIRFNTKAKIDGNPAKTFDLAWLRKQGITTKDIVAPDSLSFNTDHFIMGDKYGRVMFIDNLPTYLSTDILTDITDISCNMLTSVHYESLRQDVSMKMVKNQMTNINSNVIDAQKKAAKSGYSPDLISPELLRSQDEADKIMSDVTSKNQKMFLVTVVIAFFADSLDELNKLTKTLQTVTSKYLCNLRKLNYQQEAAFATALPLATNELAVQRLLTTESAAVFMPFSAQELSQSNGMYYGLNAVSRNLILFNRINSKNANGVILGTPGSGKSFSAKREMINVILNTNDDIYVIDPEREYAPLAALFGGEVVRIAAGSKTYINPLDMDLDYADDDDPITLKSDFIGSLCETIIGGRYGLSPIQKSVIDRCVRLVYNPYLEHLNKLNRQVTCDRDATPTLDDFYQLLLAQPEPEAQNIALALELYCRGSLDTFAHRTNVNTNSRFVIYDIKDIGSGMKEMGLQVCLNDIWNKIISNKKKGKRTWFYIDEFYLLTQTDSSARFLQQIYKRARKWAGIPTGITQNVEDLLSSKEARGVINNCDFILMLNQSPLDRAELGAMLNISPTQMSYITNSDAGQGLLYTGKFIIPFIDQFPKNNDLYRAMTTKPDEVNLEEFMAQTT